MRGGSLAVLLRDADSGSRTLLVGTAGTVALNVTGVALNFGLVLLLSRVLGATGYGAYASAFAWAAVLSVVAVLGLTPLVIRKVAAYRSLESWGLLRGLLRRANQWVALTSVLTIGVAAVLGRFIYAGEPVLLHAFWIALLLVPLIALTSLRQAAMQGLGRVVLGRVPDTVVAPLLFIVLAGAAAFLFDDITASVATALQVVAVGAAFVLGAALLRRALPAAARTTAPEYEMDAWRRSGVWLLLLNVVMAANAQVGTIVLGAASDAADAGVFNVATRVTTFISFMMLAVTYPLMPLVARLYASREVQQIQLVVIRAARAVLLVAAPTGLVLVLLAPTILRVFGAEFGDGTSAVRILAVGELVNVLTGFGGLVLVMTGHEGDLARCVGIGAAVNIALTLALVSFLEVEAAAIGTATGVATANLLMTWLAWKRLGVWAAVVGRRA